MKKRLIALVLSSLILVSVFSFGASSAGGAALSGETRAVAKDETVYAVLGNDGSIGSVSVVSHIDTPQSGVYADSGTYDKIVNLSGEEVPSLSDGKVAWQLPERPAGFYYEGVLSKAALPFLFSVTYKLNGNEMSASDIAGKAGAAEIQLKVTANTAASAYLKQKMLCQIQLPLNLETASSVSAPGASKMLTGKTETLAYMVFPGGSTEYTVRFNTTNFTFDGITATCMDFDLAGMLGADTGDLAGGVTDLADGASQVANGLSKVKDGMGDLSDGLTSSALGAKQLAGGAEQLQSGLKEYTSGAAALSSGAKTTDTGLAQLSEGGKTLATGYGQLSGGAGQLLDAMLAAMTPDQQAAFSAQVAQTKGGLAGFQSSLGTYTKGVSDASAGMKTYAKGVETFSAGGATLVAGAGALKNGVDGLSKGLSQMAGSTVALPSQLQQLVDAQLKIAGGITSFRSQLSAFIGSGSSTATPVSFASPNTAVRSVQFVLTTPAVKAETTVTAPAVAPVEKKGFFTKLLDLFR